MSALSLLAGGALFMVTWTLFGYPAVIVVAVVLFAFELRHDVRLYRQPAQREADAQDVKRLGLSAEQTAILRDHLASRQQTVSEFLGDMLMDIGLGRATGKDYPPPAAEYARLEQDRQPDRGVER